MAPSSLPVLFPDRPSQCGWLYGGFFPNGETVDLPYLTLVRFSPVTEADRVDFDDDDYTIECDSCGSTGALWFWSDVWATGVDLSGCECESCIRDDGGEAGQGWVPSPLAITAG